jgi:hypothetical protein
MTAILGASAVYLLAASVDAKSVSRTSGNPVDRLDFQSTVTRLVLSRWRGGRCRVAPLPREQACNIVKTT